jgi:cell division transport system permease protein
MRKEVIKFMKVFRILGRSIRDSFKSIIRNFSLSIAAIMCVTITLILVSVSIIVAANINNTTKNIEEELNIVVYVKREATDDEAQKIKTQIESMNKVKSVEYKSKDTWKTEMANYDKSFSTVLDYLDENPLMDSFTVKVNYAKDLDEVAKYIKTLDNVDNVKYGEGMVNSVVSVFDIVQKITWIVVIALIVVTAVLIGNTIKLTIFSRRNEIEIMRLVGASNISIKLPFIFEGFILGILGSIIPIIVTIYGYVILYTKLNGHIYSDMLTLIKPYNFVFYVSLCLMFIGVLVGMFGSLKSVRKYLKI